MILVLEKRVVTRNASQNIEVKNVAICSFECMQSIQYVVLLLLEAVYIMYVFIL